MAETTTMTEAKNTLTPWRFSINGDGDYTLFGGVCSTYTIGRVLNFNERPTNRANAAFIVRAVNAHDDLVAALKQCQSELVSLHHGDCDSLSEGERP